MRSLVLLMALGAAGAGVTWWLREREASRPLVLSVARVRSGAIAADVTASGRVESVRDLTLRASGEGRAAAVLVREGDAVTEGQELLRYDRADTENRLTQAQDRLSQADLEIRDVDRDLRITRSLVPVAGESRQRLEALEIRAEKARVARGLAEKELALARALLDRMAAQSPWPCTVIEKLVEDGEWLTPGRPLFHLADAHRLKVVTLVDEIDAPRLRVGQRAVVTSDSLPGRSFSGQVTQIYPSARVERDTTVVKVAVELDAPVQPQDGLRIGNQVDVRIIHAEVAQALMVPVESVLEVRGDAAAVFVLQAGFVRRRTVRLGLQNAREAQVLDGVSAGESVVLLLGRALPDGAPAVEAPPP